MITESGVESPHWEIELRFSNFEIRSLVGDGSSVSEVANALVACDFLGPVPLGCDVGDRTILTPDPTNHTLTIPPPTHHQIFRSFFYLMPLPELSCPGCSNIIY